MRAILAASATTTVLECALASRPRNHCPSRVLLRLKVGKAARAPWISILRKYLLPRLVMPSRRGLPPVVACRGTSPSHAARLRPRAKVSASPTAATSAVALSAPIPGMLVSRRAASSRFASTANSASNAAILSSSASYRVSMSSIRSWIRELSSPVPCRRSSVTRSLSLARPCGTMTPRSSRTARNWFIKDVRSRTA